MLAPWTTRIISFQNLNNVLTTPNSVSNLWSSTTPHYRTDKISVDPRTSRSHRICIQSQVFVCNTRWRCTCAMFTFDKFISAHCWQPCIRTTLAGSPSQKQVQTTATPCPTTNMLRWICDDRWRRRGSTILRLCQGHLPPSKYLHDIFKCVWIVPKLAIFPKFQNVNVLLF